VVLAGAGMAKLKKGAGQIILNLEGEVVW